MPQKPNIYAQAPVNCMKKRILLMDDQQMLREATGLMLNSLGYEVGLAADGETTVAMYRQAMDTGSRFDLVILDLVIPDGIGGAEVVKILRQLDPRLKAIISSGYTTDPVVEAYAEYGFDEVLSKPYSLTDLGNILQKMLAPGS